MMPARSTPHLFQQSSNHQRDSAKQNQVLYSYLHNQQGLKFGSVNTAQPQSVTTRDESPPPAPPVRDSSTLKSIKYGPGHEKFPSWPVPAAADTPQALRNPPGGGSHRSKSWTDHTNYPKETVVAYSRPYMRKQHSAYTQQKLKTVMEKCEKISPGTYESRYDKVSDRIYLPQVDHDGKPLGDMNYVVPSPPEREFTMNTPLNQEDLERYARIYHQDPMNIHPKEARKSSLQHQHLTESGLEQFMEYNKNYEDSLFNSMDSKSDESILTHLHQKQLSYAQSEGYHSYVSSTDSTATPFLDRLRKDSHAVVRSASWDETEQDHSLRHEGRDSIVTSSSGSASSSETLKWLGSTSDVSVASSSCSHLANSSLANSRQLIAHSARVQIPQRHHSESVLYISSETQDVWKDRESKNNNKNKLKLFALNTYTVQETEQASHSNRSSFQSMPSVAERISELEKQHRYSYLDPDKRHKIPDPTLKAIQKKALLSFYERHHSNNSKNNSWRSEPYLAQPQQAFAVPQPPPRIKAQIPSRRASSASDYASGSNSKRSSLSSRESKTTDTLTKITPRHQHSNSCGSLSTDFLGPIIMGPSISLDDWVPQGPPERPPKNPQLRNNFPELFHDQRVPSPDLPPPSPPTVLEDEVFNCDDPLPPPPPECGQDFNEHSRGDKSQGQFAAPQVRAMKAESPIKQTIGLPQNNTEFWSVGCRSIKTRPTEQIFHQVSSKPYNVTVTDKNKDDQMPFSNQRSYAERSDTKYPTTQKLVLNGMGNIAISQNVVTTKQMRIEPLRPHNLNDYKRSSGDSHRRSSLVDCNDNPPPLQPRQMRINQSMRVSSSSDRNQPMRCSPAKDFKDSRSHAKSQSKASVLASRRDRDRVVPDSDTGIYKRTMSPNGHAIPSEVLSESPKINSRETVWPHKNTKELIKNNNNTNLLRRVSMNEKQTITKSKQCENEDLSEQNLVLPDVLPVNAKLLSNRSHYNRPSHLNFSSLDERSDHIKKSPMKTPPSSPSKSPSRSSPFSPLRTASLSSSISPNNRTSPHNAVTNRITPSLENTPSSTYNVNNVSKHTMKTSSPLVGVTTPKPESPKMSPLPMKTLKNSSTSISPPSPKRISPQIKPQLSPSSSIKLSPSRLSPASSNSSSSLHLSPLTTSAISTSESSCLASPKKSEESPQVIDGHQMVQRTEVVLRINTSTSDASSQTEKGELPPTPLPSRRKLQEEIECELLSEDLINHLSTSDKLKDLLVPGPDHKKPTDYVQGLFKPEVTARPRPLNSPFRSRCSTPNENLPNVTAKSTSSSTTNEISVDSLVPMTTPNLDSTVFLPGSSAYFTTSEPKAKFLSRYSQDLSQCQTLRNTKDLNQKKEELVSRLGRKLEVLRSEQLVVEEESKYNEELGENVESHVSRLARPHEAAKFRLHVQEIGKITSLLLGLSGRLARVENALIGMEIEHPDRRTLEAKRDKLLSQLEEAKGLKESIDRRSVNVSNILTNYLDTEEYADYDHFINMKAKLMMDSKEIADKIKLGEEQLLALRESLVT